MMLYLLHLLVGIDFSDRGRPFLPRISIVEPSAHNALIDDQAELRYKVSAVDVGSTGRSTDQRQSARLWTEGERSSEPAPLSAVRVHRRQGGQEERLHLWTGG